jgi:arylsulfatase A-like enzyme
MSLLGGTEGVISIRLRSATVAMTLARQGHLISRLSGRGYAFGTPGPGAHVYSGGRRNRLARVAITALRHAMDLGGRNSLRGGKGGVRVPFLVRGSGGVLSASTISFDLSPTLVELAGSLESLPYSLDGGSSMPLIHGAAERARLDQVFPFSLCRGGRSVLRHPRWESQALRERRRTAL